MLRVGLVLVFSGMVIKGTVRAYREIKLMSQAAAAAAKVQTAGRFDRGIGFERTMTRAEAEHIFGIYDVTTSIESKEEIIKRHRQLMKINHPDNKGSLYIATKINEAKDMLLTI